MLISTIGVVVVERVSWVMKHVISIALTWKLYTLIMNSIIA